MPSRISFIVPTFNRAHFIAESLYSILNQLGENDDILVIDDGSTDETEAVVRDFYGRVRYVRQDNAGKSAALNRALKMTDGEYIWICDDDDVLRPGAVELLFNRLAASDAGFVFGRYTRFTQASDGSRIDLGTGYWPDLRSGSLARHILEDAFPMQNGALVRRSAYEVVGPFDETLPRSIDYDMFVRLALAVGVDYVDALVFDQRKHDGPRGPRQNLHAAADSMKVWLDYDRRIFDRIDAKTPLAVFEALFEGEDALLVRRAGLLQRACVWARHDRWHRALDDLRQAAALDGNRVLHPVEAGICQRILNGKHGFDGALEHENAAANRALGRASNVGRMICSEMAVGGLWMLRRPQAGRRGAMMRMALNMLRAAGVDLLLAVKDRSRHKGNPEQLRERRQARPWEVMDVR